MMIKTFRLSAASLLLGSSLLSASVLAQEAPVVCPGYQPGKTKLVGQSVGKKVQRAYEAYTEERIDEAIQILSDIDASDEFDKAYANRFLGNLLAGQEGQGARALQILRDSVKTKVLNDGDHGPTLKLVADLSLQEEKYNEAIEWYQKWMDFTCKEDAQTYTRIGQAYISTKQYAKVIAPADKAIALAEKPDKNPYVLKLQSYLERKMYPEVIKVNEQLVELFPGEADWWIRLGFFYTLVEDFPKALSTFEIAYNEGFLKKEAEIKHLSQLYVANGMPWRGAKLLEKHLKSGLLKKDEPLLSNIGNAYHQARNYKDAAGFYGQAAEISSDPKHYKKQGTLLLVAEDYKGAIKALKKALERGIEDEGDVHFALMEAHFYLGDFKEANRYVQLAKKDKSVRRNAVAWEPYIKEKAKNRGIDI